MILLHGGIKKMATTRKKTSAPPIAVQQEKIDTTIRNPSLEKVGVVVNCSVLNVRKVPNPVSEILFTIERGTHVKIDIQGSTENYYRVMIQGVEGFCKKDFIGV
jgi:uncharacterized protein YgiM (DUF1202 family)